LTDVAKRKTFMTERKLCEIDQCCNCNKLDE